MKIPAVQSNAADSPLQRRFTYPKPRVALRWDANEHNQLRLSVFANAQHGQVLLAAVFDNLGKGASGAAVQNLDLMLERMAKG